MIFFSSEEETNPVYELTAITTTNRKKLCFHIKQRVGGKVSHCEYFVERMFEKHFYLRCLNRKNCKSKLKIELVNINMKEKPRKILNNGKEDHHKQWEIVSTEDESQQVGNYGEIFHKHTKTCKGKS